MMTFQDSALSRYERYRKGRASPWIPVLETYPPLNEPVLAIADGKFFCIAEVFSDHDRGGLWAFNDDWLYTPTEPRRFVKGEYVHITHWMPLPALPKRETYQVVEQVIEG